MKGILSSWSRKLFQLPRLPKPSSPRETAADYAFILFRFLARYGFLVVAVVGAFFFEIGGFVYGLLIGAILGFWIRFSLGLRQGDPTHAFFVRMHERTYGSKAGFLESILETLRGCRLTPEKCQKVAVAYNDLRHHLQTCDSDIERSREIRKFEQTVFAVMYGPRPFPEQDFEAAAEAGETAELKADG